MGRSSSMIGNFQRNNYSRFTLNKNSEQQQQQQQEQQQQQQQGRNDQQSPSTSRSSYDRNQNNEGGQQQQQQQQQHEENNNNNNNNNSNENKQENDGGQHSKKLQSRSSTIQSIRRPLRQDRFVNIEQNDELLLEETRTNLSCGILNAGQEDEMTIVGYRKSMIRTIICWFFFIITVGLLRLIMHWWSHWLLLATHVECPLDLAEKILISEHFEGKHTVHYVKNILNLNPITIEKMKLEKEKWTEMIPFEQRMDDKPFHVAIHFSGGVFKYMDSIRLFKCKQLRYIWDRSSYSFIKLKGLDANVPSTVLHQQFGLNESDQYARRLVYGPNQIAIPLKSIFTLLFLEALNPFYVFQVFSVCLWFAYNYYYYAVVIVLMSAFGITMSIMQTRKNQLALYSTVRNADCAIVQNDLGKSLTVETKHLVPGDLLEIPSSGCTMQCDAVLLSGNCILDESMLTGESVPITKTPLPCKRDLVFDLKDHGRHVLFSGTKVIQTRYIGTEKVLAIVINTGNITAKGGLIRSILYPPPVDYKFEEDSYKFIMLLGIIAGIGFIYTLYTKISRDVSPSKIAIESLDLITIAVPPALPAAMTVGRFYAQKRLEKNNIYCISPRSINVAGSIDCVCFDKTGTLTEDGLDMWGVVQNYSILDEDHHPAAVVPLHEQQQNIFQLPVHDILTLKYDHFLFCMVTCHSITIMNGELKGDPLDLKMFESSGWQLEEANIADDTKYDLLFPTTVRPPRPPSQAQTLTSPGITSSASSASSSSPAATSTATPATTSPIDNSFLFSSVSQESIGSMSPTYTMDAAAAAAAGSNPQDGRLMSPGQASSAKPPPPPPSSKHFGKHLEIGIVREFSFTSTLQRMSVITRTLTDDHFMVYCKGSPEMIETLCLPATIPRDFDQKLNKYAQQGYRIISIAYKKLDKKLAYAKVQRISREKIECDLIFLGFVILENRLKPDTTHIIRDLTAANIRTVMVTGDNILTALSVAKDCEMIRKGQSVITVNCGLTADTNEYEIYYNLESGGGGGLGGGVGSGRFDGTARSRHSLTNEINEKLFGHRNVNEIINDGNGERLAGGRIGGGNDGGGAAGGADIENENDFNHHQDTTPRDTLMALSNSAISIATTIDTTTQLTTLTGGPKSPQNGSEIINVDDDGDDVDPAETAYDDDDDDRDDDDEYNLNDVESKMEPELATNNYRFAMTGKTWSILREYYPDLLEKFVTRGTVFARMSPDQKQSLILELQDLGYYVAMCGDGANDCGALKAAHTGISLSEAESSVASPFTSKNPTIGCVPNVIKEGRAALVTLVGIFKYMAAYSLVQFVSVLMLYSIDSNLTDIEFLYIDLFMISVFAFFFGKTEAYDGPLVKQQPLNSLISLSPVASLVFHLMIAIAFQIGGWYHLHAQDWFVPFNYTAGNEFEHGCHENYTIFIISCFQYIILAFVFSKGAPYRKQIYTNYGFIIAILCNTIFSIYITIEPAPGLANFLELIVPEDIVFRLYLLGYGVANLLLSIGIEYLIIDRIFIKHLRYRWHNLERSRRKYLFIENELRKMVDWPVITKLSILEQEQHQQQHQQQNHHQQQQQSAKIGWDGMGKSDGEQKEQSAAQQSQQQSAAQQHTTNLLQIDKIIYPMTGGGQTTATPSIDDIDSTQSNPLVSTIFGGPHQHSSRRSRGGRHRGDGSDVSSVDGKQNTLRSNSSTIDQPSSNSILNSFFDHSNVAMNQQQQQQQQQQQSQPQPQSIENLSLTNLLMPLSNNGNHKKLSQINGETATTTTTTGSTGQKFNHQIHHQNQNHNQNNNRRDEETNFEIMLNPLQLQQQQQQQQQLQQKQLQQKQQNSQSQQNPLIKSEINQPDIDNNNNIDMDINYGNVKPSSSSSSSSTLATSAAVLPQLPTLPTLPLLPPQPPFDGNHENCDIILESTKI